MMTVMIVLSQMYIFYFCVLLFEADIESWIPSNFIPSQYPQLVHTSIDYPLADDPFDNISSFFHHQITNPTHRDCWWLRTNADTQANIDSAYRSDALLILLLIPDQLSVAWKKAGHYRPLLGLLALMIGKKAQMHAKAQLLWVQWNCFAILLC